LQLKLGGSYGLAKFENGLTCLIIGEEGPSAIGHAQTKHGDT